MLNMTRRGSIARPTRDDNGAVLIMVALMLPVLVSFSGLVLDVGNWYAHKRHLQTQADAGALAGAGKYRVPCDASVNADIKATAGRYSGPSSEYPAVTGYNPQIGKTPTDKVHIQINKPTWYDQTSPVDDTVSPDDPCGPNKPMVDVKMTETDLPWFLKLAQVNFINTHARVEIRKKVTSTGSIPVGVPEVDPKSVKAVFVDESDGTVIAERLLGKVGTSAGVSTFNNDGLAGRPGPVSVDIGARTNIGVRIVLSGSSSTNCVDPLVTCYDTGSDKGLAFIRGWSSATAGGATSLTPPQARDVRLFGDGCEDGYFTAKAAAYPCTVNVGAVVDFGAEFATSRVLAKKTSDPDSKAVELSAPADAAGLWTGGGISVSAEQGPVTIDLLWKTGCPTDRTQSCSAKPTLIGTGKQQRTFSGSLARSGPLNFVRVSKNGIPGANSFENCATGSCPHDLVVTIGVRGGLGLAQPGDDPVVLKVAAGPGGGSLTQALDCDQDLNNIKSELAYGCTTGYTKNTGELCPLSSQALDDQFGVNPPNEWPCVGTNQGAAVGQVSKGLNLRVFGDENATSSACPSGPNKWPNYPPSDKRIVQLFVTPFGAFNGQGDTTVAVTDFADFYVTGWHNGPCQGVLAAQGGDDDASSGEIVGHFIKKIDSLNGGAGEEFCDFGSLGSCAAVITR